MPRYPNFEVTPSHFGGNPNLGRTTKVKELSTGLEAEFMDAMPKGKAIEQFKIHFGRI